MGNRILKESIRMSREIDSLSWFEEVMFYRLIVTVDDYGVFPADPVVLAHILFPMKEKLDKKAVRAAVEHMEVLGLVRRYQVKGKGSFLKIAAWEKHQRLRSSRRRFPAPEEADCEPAEEEEPAEEHAAEEKQPLSGEETDAVPEEPGEEEAREAPVVELPLNDRTSYVVTCTEVNEYAELYPAVDIVRELRKMRGWCLSNPQKRKTRSGIKKFITGWLAREQDRGGGWKTTPPLPDNPFIRMAMEDSENNACKEDTVLSVFRSTGWGGRDSVPDYPAPGNS